MFKYRPIAIHLPQFHPIPENDAWWGKGFTEWTNVAKAKPLFEEHYQPHLPADLGYYDLRLEEARLAQEALAKQYGIYGFCYYHYWFNGKRLLHEPVDRKLKDPKEDLPFMLCWANENWTRRWDGLESEILMNQEYSEADDIAHIRFLCQNFFSDKRYIRVNGKPFFIIYRPSLFPDLKRTIQVWREEARKLGIEELYIGYMTSYGQIFDHEAYNLDAAIEFAPHFYHPKRKFGSLWNVIFKKAGYYRKRVFQKLGIEALIRMNERLNHVFPEFKNYTFNKNNIFDYQNVVEDQMKRVIKARTFPSLFPMWDNSSRKKENAYIYINSTPELYKKWLKSIKDRFKPFSKEENFIFINAWNEWAEGNHLEPCQKWGTAYLKATGEAFDENEAP